MAIMKAYKATYNGKCKNITFEEGKEYSQDGELVICENGFHFCKNPIDTLAYYIFTKDFQLMEIEVLGEVIEEGNKSVTNKLKVIKFLSEDELKELFKDNLTWNERYQITYFKDSKGYAIWYEYDQNGNETHFKDSNGFEYWREYDQNGNLKYSKDSKGYECWREYDQNGRFIHFKDSKCYEEWREYDQNGKLTHYKDPYGYEEWREFDQNGNPTHFKDSNGVEEWKEYDQNGNLTHYKNSKGFER